MNFLETFLDLYVIFLKGLCLEFIHTTFFFVFYFCVSASARVCVRTDDLCRFKQNVYRVFYVNFKMLPRAFCPTADLHIVSEGFISTSFTFLVFQNFLFNSHRSLSSRKIILRRPWRAVVMALTETVLQAGRGSLARVSVLVSLISALGDHSDPPAHGNSLINSAFYGPLSLPSSLPLHHALTLTPSPLSLTTHSFICHLPPSTVSCVFFAFVAHSCSFFCDYCDAAFRHLIFLRASCLSLLDSRRS